jgi:gamma-butyrobetaine dioxygenase/trimethyllysine dioxygenase
MGLAIISTASWCGGVAVTWSDGATHRFHNIWLRDNCRCATCGDHAGGSRFQALLDIEIDIAPASVDMSADVLHIVWSDGHLSSFDAVWLRAYAYDLPGAPRLSPERTLWDSSLSPLPTVDFSAALQDVHQRRHLFAQVATLGFVIVRNVGSDPAATMRLAFLLGYVRDTHFGPVSDLMPRTRRKHLSDYATAILPHTDETYRPTPIGINIFHCINPSDDDGGVSHLVDGHRCAALLKATHPSAFALLQKAPIRHERRAPGEIIRSYHPAITLDATGQISEVRLNERTMTGLNVAFDEMEGVYGALRKIFAIAYAPENRIEYLLRKGEALVFDNLRILHGRSAFAGHTRHLRQTNVFRDEFHARLAFLNEARAEPADSASLHRTAPAWA